MDRPSFSETFLEIAQTVSKRGTCPRLKVGAVITRHNRIIATGYNGAPPGLSHCTEVGCIQGPCSNCQSSGYVTSRGILENCPNCKGTGFAGGCKRAIHAEANAILQLAKVGPAGAGGKLYCTHEPCIDCSKLIIGAGIETVYFSTGYGSEFMSEASEMLRRAGVAVYAISAK